MLASSGDSGPPCGVPFVLAFTTRVHQRAPPQVFPDQMQHPFVPDDLRHPRHQNVVIDVIEGTHHTLPTLGTSPSE